MILKDIIKKFDKSNIKAGDGLEKGNYPLYTCSPVVNKFLNDYLYDDEAIIISTGGNFAAHYVKGRFNYSTDCYVFNTDKYNLKYLYYFLLSKNEDINKMFRGAGLKHLNKNEFVMLNVKEIPLNEQDRIVNQLDKINEMIKVRKKEIDKCNNLIKSQFVEMFGDPKTNKKGWIKASMGEYMTVLTDFSSNGSYKTLDSTVTMYDEPNYAYMVRTTDLENEDYKNNVKYITEEAYNFLAKSKVYPNDIIMNKIGSAGKVYIMPDVGMPVSLGRNAFLFRYSEKIEPVFIYYLLKSEYGVNEISQYVRGAVTKTITKDDARKVKIIVPPIELQKKFTQIVEQIDKQKFEFESSLKKLEELQASLMQEYFG